MCNIGFGSNVEDIARASYRREIIFWRQKVAYQRKNRVRGISRFGSDLSLFAIIQRLYAVIIEE
jgi:hypothetical protein